MNAMATALRLGLTRGRIELRQYFTYPRELIEQVFFLGLSVTVLLLLRSRPVPSTHFSLSSSILPSALGMNIALAGLLGLATQLATDREDGTLLRAKAVPNGVIGYIIGKIALWSGRLLIGIVLILIEGALLLNGVALSSPGAWLTLAWVIPLGLVATLPVGIVLGSLVSPRAVVLVMLALVGLTAISGIFYPITHLPALLQGIAQVFPVYWLGLGMRSGLLPHALASVEIGRSWRQWQTATVLGAWAIFGLCTAPVVVRRMARRESGSSLAARREKLLRRGG
jgi:ABC-2 type transport system permease protein